MAHDNKTEQPTPRRRQKAREQGQVARSRDLIASVATMAGLVVVMAQGSDFPRAWRGLLGRTLDLAVTSDLGTGAQHFAWRNLGIFRGAALAMGMSWLLAAAAALAQGGPVFAPAALAPKLSRMSPASRVSQLFSLTALSRMLKSLLPVTAIVYLSVSLLSRDWSAVLTLGRQSVRGVAGFGLGHVFEVAWKASLALLVWSVADYFIERQRMEGDLRMSRQELRDEFKETEGNPAVKARIRRLQRQVRRRRMLEDLKRAAVVITNPNEFAVALEYGPQMAVPVVVAKGRNLLAQQIKQAARWHEIPMVENPPLAHALYRAVEIGQSIPPKLYTVVAGILAAIYHAQQRAQTLTPSRGHR